MSEEKKEKREYLFTVKTIGGKSNDNSFLTTVYNKLDREVEVSQDKSGDNKPFFLDNGFVELNRRIKQSLRRKSWDYLNDEDHSSSTRDDISPTGDERPTDFYTEPYKLSDWVLLPELSSKIFTSINILKNNCVGNGYEIIPAKEEKYLTEEEKKRFEEEKNILEKFFEYPNNIGEDTNEVFEKFFLCREYCGVGALRFGEDINGDVYSMEYFPAFKLKVRKDGFGFFVENYEYFNSDKEYFKMFGDKRIMSKKTGKFGSDIKGSEDFVPVEERADSILWIPIFVPGSPVTGMPRYAPAKDSLVGNALSSKLNVNLFVKGLITRLLILIQNGRLDDDSIEAIEDFFNSGKGIENLKNAIVVQPNKKSVMSSDLIGDSQNRVKIEIVKLLEGNKEDATFQNYRLNNDKEQQRIFSLPDLFYGVIGDVSKNAAKLIREVAQEQVFDPIATEIERVLNNKLIPELLSVKNREKINSEKLLDILQENKDKLNLNDNFKFSLDASEQLEYLKIFMLKKNYRLSSINEYFYSDDDEIKFSTDIIFDRKSISRFKFKKPDLIDVNELIEMLKSTASIGSWTPNNAIDHVFSRIFPDMKKFEEDWGNIPMNMLVMLINSKLPPFEDPYKREEMDLQWAKLGISEDSSSGENGDKQQNKYVRDILRQYNSCDLSEFVEENPDVLIDTLFSLKGILNESDKQ